MRRIFIPYIVYMGLTQIYLFEFLNNDEHTQTDFLSCTLALSDCALIMYLCRIELL